MRILFADKFPHRYLEKVTELGHDCVLEPELGAGDLPDKIAGFDALVVRSTRVTAETIAAADRLALVIRAGAGTNTIDKQAAAERRVPVCNVPGRNAIAVAELVLGLILCIDRNIPDNVIDLRRGTWDKKRYSEAAGLYGRPMGIVGLGAIGLAVAERAAAFGLRLHVVHKPERSAEARARLDALAVEYAESVDALASGCDILSFHLPAAPETRHMIGANLLALVRPGAIIINTSRGDIVDEPALLEALDTKGIRAGLDVYADEPGSAQAPFDSPLASHPGVYGTHHIGASTAQAQNAVAEGVVEIIESFVGGETLHCVNM